MRLSVMPFKHPEYSALLERSESLALLWGIGHVCFILFLVMALVAPIGVAMVAMIDSDVTRESLVCHRVLGGRSFIHCCHRICSQTMRSQEGEGLSEFHWPDA